MDKTKFKIKKQVSFDDDHPLQEPEEPSTIFKVRPITLPPINDKIEEEST